MASNLSSPSGRGVRQVEFQLARVEIALDLEREAGWLSRLSSNGSKTGNSRGTPTERIMIETPIDGISRIEAAGRRL